MIASFQTPTRNHDVVSIIKNSHTQLGVHLFISLYINLFVTHRNCHTDRDF